MGLAERDALPHQSIGEIGGGQHLVRRSRGETLAVELDSAEHPGGRGKAELQVVDRVEQRLLVLLQVLAIGEWQPVHRPQQA
jgi:hypothetical protein